LKNENLTGEVSQYPVLAGWFIAENIQLSDAADLVRTVVCGFLINNNSAGLYSAIDDRTLLAPQIIMAFSYI